MSAQPPKLATHAKEGGGHFYDQQGNQIESVTSADGKRQIKCTLRHARELQLARGVTSIMGNAHKEALVKWQVKQGILAALTLPRLAGETDEAFVDRVVDDSREQVRQAADIGTRIHAAVQSTIQRTPVAPEMVEPVAKVLAQIDLVCGPQDWRSEVGVASSWGYGTKLDLVSDEWLLDFKSKDGDQAALDAQGTYDEHAMQLGAGGHAIDPRRPRKCGIVFVSRTHPGVCRVVGIDADAIERGLAMFRALLDYTFHKDRYRPSWASF